MKFEPVILASQSPRRIRLLKQLGLDVIVQASCFVEHELEQADPTAFARQAALGKARDVAARSRQGLVAGMDTVVALDGQMLHKPRDPADAVRILRALSAREHLVTTGLALVRAPTGEALWAAHETTRVRFRRLNADEIERYVASGEPLDKAGAYGIQGLGAELVAGIEGDYFNVMGLPLAKFLKGLGRFVDVSALELPAAPAAFAD
ncbi:Maf family protein [Candidatus Sumerlaeota bacterium]